MSRRDCGDGILVRPYRPGDEAALLALHNAAFREQAARSPRHWAWKYRDNPLRRTDIVLAVAGQGAVLGAYCGIPHRLHFAGAETEAELHADVAIDARLRRGLTGARLAARLMRAHFARFGGDPARPIPLTWGFPAPGLLRIGMRFCRSFVLRDVLFLLKESTAPLPCSSAGCATTAVRRFGAGADALWQRCRGELRLAVIRDAAYLNWRYAEHPDRDHLLLEVRDGDGGRVRALAACRDGGWNDELFSILDWLAPADDLEAEAALLRACLDAARRRGKRWIACWLAGDQARLQRFQSRHGFIAQPSPYQQCFRAFVPGVTRQQLFDDWFQTMGDMDFF